MQKEIDINFESLRAQFPILAHKTYLNSGSYGALAAEVRTAIEAFVDDRETVGTKWGEWESKFEGVREGLANLLRAKTSEIAVTAATSAGLNSLASALDFTGRRNKVVVSDFEFPTNAQIWHAQEPRGARVVHVPVTQNGFIPLEQFEELIDEETLLVAITHVCYRNGAKLDLAGIARLAHAKGAKILVDCYQSVGTELIDVKALDLDFAAGGTHKYLLGAGGLGFLYVRDELIPTLTPTSSGWYAQSDIGAMDIAANRPSLTAARFQAGAPPALNCCAADAGLKFINKVGIEAIEARVRELTKLCMEKLEEIGWPAITPTEDHRRGPLIAVRARDAEVLVQILRERGIIASQRDSNLRLGFHFYNNENDIQNVVTALLDNRRDFRFS